MLVPEMIRHQNKMTHTCSCIAPADFLDKIGCISFNNIVIKLKDGDDYSVIGFPGCNLDDEDDDELTDVLVWYCERVRTDGLQRFHSKEYKGDTWCLTLMNVADNTFLLKFRSTS